LLDDIQVNAEVRVNENISHAGDVRPRDTRGQRFTLLDQVADGLADDLEVPDHRRHSLGGNHRLVENPVAELRFERSRRHQFNPAADALGKLLL